MKTNKHVLIVNTLLSIIVALVMVGCGKKTSGSGASVDVQFSNLTDSNLKAELKAVGPRGILNAISLQESDLLGESPLVFQMKLVAFYMVEAIDPVTWNNIGDATRIWTSRKCDDDLTYCGIGPSAGQYKVDYFNFAAGTAAVNQALANYKRDTKESTLNPGTYNYIRADFTGKVGNPLDDGIPNMMFGSIEAHEVRAQQQALLIHLPEPLVLEEGESFTVDLAYDLENRYYPSGTANSRPAEVSQSQFWTCDGVGSDVPCIVEPDFVPTVTKK